MAKDGPKSLQVMLQSLEQCAKERAAAGEGHTPAPPGTAKSRASMRVPASTGTPGPAVIAAANEKLERFVRQRGIEQFELFPSNEFPTPFTRLPLFPPVQRTTARRAATGDWIALHSRCKGKWGQFSHCNFHARELDLEHGKTFAHRVRRSLVSHHLPR